MDENLVDFERDFVPLLKYAKERKLTYRVEQCPMPGWTTKDNWHNQIAYTPGTWIALHRICEKHGVGDQFRIHYDPSHAILMGQDTRSLFQYLKDEGYNFLIGGFHVKGQVTDAKGVSAWGYGGQTVERGDWIKGKPSPKPADQVNAWKKQTVLCEHELPGTAQPRPARVPAEPHGRLARPPARRARAAEARRGEHAPRRRARVPEGPHPGQGAPQADPAGLDRLHAQDRRGRGLHVRAAERRAEGAGHPGPGASAARPTGASPHDTRRIARCCCARAWRRRAQAAEPPYTLRSPDGRIELRVATAERLRFGVRLGGSCSSTARRCRSTSTTSCSGLPRRSARRRPRASTAWSRRRSRGEPRRSPSATPSCGSSWRAATRSCSAPTTTASPTASRRRCRSAEVHVYAEEASLSLRRATGASYFPKEDGFMSHNERKYAYQPLKDMAKGRSAACRPSSRRAGGIKIAVAESDVVGLPGAVARGHGRQRARRDLPGLPARGEEGARPRLKVVRRADYIARDARDAQLTRGGSSASPRRTPTC